MCVRLMTGCAPKSWNIPHDSPGRTLGFSMPIQFRSCQKPVTTPLNVLAWFAAVELIKPSGASFEKMMEVAVCGGTS